MLSDCLQNNGKQPDKSVRILCVDDEPYILSTLQRFFRKDNFEILVANSAENGLNLLKERGPVNIVVSDYRMPGLNGVEFLLQVHQIWPQTVGILLSGYADLTNVTSAMELDFIYRYLPKPWSRTELREAIKDALVRGADALNSEDDKSALER